ncbi:MAG: C39 family peptidase [bacterium]
MKGPNIFEPAFLMQRMTGFPQTVMPLSGSLEMSIAAEGGILPVISRSWPAPGGNGEPLSMMNSAPLPQGNMRLLPMMHIESLSSGNLQPMPMMKSGLLPIGNALPLPMINFAPLPIGNFEPLPMMNFEPTPAMFMSSLPRTLAMWQPMIRRVIFLGSAIKGMRIDGTPTIVKYYLDTYTGKQICGHWQGQELSASDYNWWYGCSPTSAGMVMGYYDIYGYNGTAYDLILGGIAELSSYYFNSPYPIDLPVDPPDPSGPTLLCNKAITSIEHLSDFWLSYGSIGDPLVLGRIPAQFNCLADFMGTSQDNLTSAGEGNPDGQTFFYFWVDGSPMTDLDIVNLGYDVYNYSGTYGMIEYAQYCGHRASAFNQYIAGYQGNTLGFTFADYAREIDAGRPVIIHLLGHTMLGIGYYLASDTIIVHNGWNNSALSGPLTMIWGGTYQAPDGSLLQHHAVTCFTPL